MKVKNFISIIKKNYLLKLGNSEKIVKYWRNEGLIVGNGCIIYGNVNFGSEPFLIEIGDNVKITSNVNFITHDGGMHTVRNLYSNPDVDKFNKIKVGNNVFIGYNVIILPGVEIGDNCIIGAGSVVTKSLRSNSVVAGVPAKFIKTIDEYYKQNELLLDHTKGMSKEQKKKYLVNKYNSE